jgi:hypothetical protein
MKSKRQAQIWRKKIGWFKDGEIREISVVVLQQPADGESKTRIEKVLALVKDNLALHSRCGAEGWDPDSFTVSELSSGLLIKTYGEKTETLSEDFQALSDKVRKHYITDDFKRKYGITLDLNEEVQK